MARRASSLRRAPARHGGETTQHDDLHDAQVLVRDARCLFFDWGDSCVSHPFFSMSVTLEGGLAWGLDDNEGSVDVTPFRDAHLRPFASFAVREELEEAQAKAVRLGWVCRALNVRRIALALDPPHQEEWAKRVRLRLQMVSRVGQPAEWVGGYPRIRAS